MPAQTSEAVTSDRIVAAATRLFAARGYDGTSVQAIADAVGLRKQSLLHWFPSKAHIRDAVLDSVLDHWRETVPRALAAATTGSRRFEGLIGEVVTFFQADPDRARVLLRESLDRPEELGKRLRDRLAPWMPLVTDAIRLGQQSGRVHDNLDPEAWLVELVLTLVGSFAVDSVSASLLGGDPAILRERRTRELVRLARSSLFKTRPPSDLDGVADDDPK
jgi:TetR/AcrR family transcriptional regulator